VEELKADTEGNQREQFPLPTDDTLEQKLVLLSVVTKLVDSMPEFELSALLKKTEPHDLPSVRFFMLLMRLGWRDFAGWCSVFHG
jgi:hypothetical protein